MAENGDPLGDDLQLGAGHGGAVEVRRLADGRAVILPASPSGRRLGTDGLEVLADLEQEYRALQEIRARIAAATRASTREMP